MPFISTVTLLINGLTLTLALGFLVIVLWQDSRKELNQFFAMFLILVMLWNMGSLLGLVSAFVASQSEYVVVAISLMELGFTGSSVAIYILTASLVGFQTRRFRLLAFGSLVFVITYRLLLNVIGAPINFEVFDNGLFNYQFQPLTIVFYLIFNSASCYLLWRYRRKVRSQSLIVGITTFVIGQSLGLLNPELRSLAFSVNVGSIAALITSFALLRQEILTPLAESVSQVKAMYRVSLAITSQLSLDEVLDQIATQAGGLLNADAACLFLIHDQECELVALHNLPKQLLHHRVSAGDGLIGKVVSSQIAMKIDNYQRDWKGKQDLPLTDTFASVICVPLVYAGAAIGVLMVIAGPQGRLFTREDVQLLGLLGPQAAVAIAHSRYFAEQRRLTNQVEYARSQLETVLAGTENPVVAIDRKFSIIFSNPAAKRLLGLKEVLATQSVVDLLPGAILPPDLRAALRDVRRKRTHTYEVWFSDRIYICHLARLGDRRTSGWVAVLNDVTELKELDRLKSEMIRMTSHDLKNPLQAASANLELLRDDLEHYQDAEVQESIDVIDKQLMRMQRIISGILDLERVKSGKLTMELCSPVSIVDHSVDEMRHSAADKSITLNAQVDSPLPMFWGDVEQFQRALINLIENAIKFTPSDGEVNVVVFHEEGFICFQVADSGIGIPRSMQAQVFERFFRANQKGSEHISGSGLGLSLVKAIVENHNGTIQLESEENSGTRFKIRIPAAPDSALQRQFVSLDEGHPPL